MKYHPIYRCQLCGKRVTDFNVTVDAAEPGCGSSSVVIPVDESESEKIPSAVHACYGGETIGFLVPVGLDKVDPEIEESRYYEEAEFSFRDLFHRIFGI